MCAQAHQSYRIERRPGSEMIYHCVDERLGQLAKSIGCQTGARPIPHSPDKSGYKPPFSEDSHCGI